MSKVFGRYQYRVTLTYSVPSTQVNDFRQVTLGWADATAWAALEAATMEHIQKLIPFSGNIVVTLYASQAILVQESGSVIPIQEKIMQVWHDGEYRYSCGGCEVLPDEIRGGLLPLMFPGAFVEAPPKQ